MFKQKPFLFSLIVLIILITLHAVGSYYSWYWVYSWFDIIVHITSGLWIALLVLWLASILGEINSLKEFKIKSFLVAVVSALLFGVFWELLENLSQVTNTRSSVYSYNTAFDLVSDAMGGILAYLYFVKRKRLTDDLPNVLHPFYNQTGIIKS